MSRAAFATTIRTGGDALAFEIEATARHYLFELGKVGVMFEASGGGSFASRDIPPGGRSANWIFGLGPSIEIPLTDTTDLLVGYQWRHLSNGAGGESPSNPTQNDHRIWAGVAFDW